MEDGRDSGRGTQTGEGGGGEAGGEAARQLLDALCSDMEIFSLISERHPDVLQQVMLMKQWKK